MSESVAGADSIDPGRPDVAALLERVRRADARRWRRRHVPAEMSETDRAALRFILEAGRTKDVTTGMIVTALHLAAATGTALIDRLAARGLVMVVVHPHDRRKKIVRLVDAAANPDDLDPLTTSLRAIASRLTLSDARAVAGFLEEVLATLSRPVSHA